MASVLVVDDDQQVREMLRTTLERAGYEVTEARDGRLALYQFRRSPADVVLLDMLMPEMEGIETIRSLKQDYPDVKIIAMSGGGRANPEAYLASALHCGALRAFAKPVDRDRLLQALDELLAPGSDEAPRQAG